MKFIKRVIVLVTVLLMLASNTYAEETKTMTFKATSDGENIGIVEADIRGEVDNSDLQVEVIKQVGSETTVIYTGKLGGYDNGIWNSVDFAEIQFLVIFDWNTMEDEAIYIKPILDNETNNSAILSAYESEVTVYQNSIIQAATENAEIDVSLLYNNAYSESVLLPGEELTAELEISNNNTEAAIELSAIIALYDSAGRMIDMNVESLSLDADSNGSFDNKIVVPAESTITNAKIMIWESINSLKPYVSPVVLTLTGNDFFGDDYNLSQSINGKNKANGKINSSDDIDVFSFVPQNDGLYYFESFSEIDTYASIYAEDDLENAIATDDNSGTDNNFRLSATLNSDTTYYLYLSGGTEGQYTLNYGYSIGNVFGTVSPVKFFDDDSEFNSVVEAKIDLKTYYTDEFVATMHLKDWSESSSEYASYSMTGVHSGEYLIETKRPGYLTHYQKISLTDNAVDLGSIALIPGDVNEDNVIDNTGVNMVTALLGISYGEEGYINSHDINADKIIDELDLVLVNSNLNKNSNEYGSNANVILINPEIYDSQLIVSGNATPDSIVNCVIFYDGYSIYEEETTCEADGTFEYIVDLNRNGTYSISVTSSIQAFEATETIEY